VCVNAKTDVANCGACGVKCAAGQVCSNGACTLSCQAGLTNCNGVCTNTTFDPSNCGACGTACGANKACVNSACVALGSCSPSGARAPLTSLTEDTASGCWNGNVCATDQYTWNSLGQNFQAFGQAISCSGASTCVGNVGIATYGAANTCQGRWNVYCDGVSVGLIDTLPTNGCVGSAMNNGCKVSFTPRPCATIRLVAATDNDATSNCCGGSSPDSMIVAVSAW
jgi:hypothetical protein